MKRLAALFVVPFLLAPVPERTPEQRQIQKIEQLQRAQQAAAGDILSQTTADGLYQPKDTDLNVWAGLTPSAFFQTLVDDANQAAALSTLGALASSSYTASDVLTKLLTVDGSGSGLDADLLDGNSSAAFQTADSDLTSIAALTTTAHGRGLLDDADATASRASIGAVIGTNVEAWDADLDSWAGVTRASGFDTFTATPSAANLATLVTGESYGLTDAELAALAGLTSAADRVPYFTGSGTAALATFSSAGRDLIDDADASAQRTTLGLVIGTNVQAFDADLTSLSNITGTPTGSKYLRDDYSWQTVAASGDGLGSDGDKGDVVVGGTGTTLTLDSGVVTAAAKTVLDDASTSAMLTTLGGQPLDADLTALAGVTSAAGTIPYFTGSGTATGRTIGTARQILRVNSGATAPEWFSDLVYVPTTADTAVNVTSDATIATVDLANVAAGDQVEAEAWFTILNNSGATRVYVITLDCDNLFDIEFSTGALAASSTLMHVFHVSAVCDIRATNLAYQAVEVQGRLAAGIASGGDVTMAATNLQGMSWGTSTSNATGTLTVNLKVRSANATATQTLRLHSFIVRRVAPT